MQAPACSLTSLFLVEANPQDSYVMAEFARFLDRCDQIEMAEEYYLKALEVNPNNSACTFLNSSRLHFSDGLTDYVIIFLFR